jgi:hypothetical protein
VAVSSVAARLNVPECCWRVCARGGRQVEGGLLCSVGVEGVERMITAKTCRVTQNCLLLAMTHVFATFILSMGKSEEWRMKSEE